MRGTPAGLDSKHGPQGPAAPREARRDCLAPQPSPALTPTPRRLTLQLVPLHASPLPPSDGAPPATPSRSQSPALVTTTTTMKHKEGHPAGRAGGLPRQH